MTLRQGLARSPAGGEAAAPRWRRALRLAVLAVIVVVVAAVIAGQWRSVRPLLGRLDPATVGGAAAAVFGGIYATFLSWRAVLADLGAPLPVAGGMRVFFLGQLGKYLPGSLWPAMTQMELGRDYKVPQRASGAAVVVFMLMVVGTGLLVAVPLVLLTGGDAARRYGWIAAGLPPGRRRQARRVAQTVVQGNGVETSRTSATRETKRTNPAVDQWFRWPGVLPRS